MPPTPPHQGETILTTFKSITLTIETTLIMNALILDGLGFDLSLCTVLDLTFFFVVLCIIECNISSFLIFHFMLNMPKSFDDDNGVDA